METDEKFEQMGGVAGVTDAAIARRKLLKAAIGTGVAAAAYTAPKVSVVPAYGLTSTSRSNGRCYGLGWSSNNPTGKGWMKLSGQQGLFGGNVSGPDTGPAAHAGNGTAVYTWTFAAFDSIPAFTLTITASGCVNNGTAQWVVSGLPAGYCLKFYNSGRAYSKDSGDVTVCGATANLLPVGNSQASPGSVVNNGLVTISGQGAATCTNDGGFGKVKWTFDIAPC